MTPEEFAGIDKLHTLLDVAIIDGQSILSNKYYDFNAKTWHEPVEGQELCVVCLAGAVMARTLKASFSRVCEPSDFSRQVARNLRVIDYLRSAQIWSAYLMIHPLPPRGSEMHARVAAAARKAGQNATFRAPQFRSRGGFAAMLKRMRKLCDFLEDRGL